MHELSIAEAIIETTRKALANKKVDVAKAVHIEVGPLSGIDVANLEFVFPLVIKDSPLENLLLKIQPVPLVLRCLNCGSLTKTFKVLVICDKCNSRNVEIVEGKELLIKSIEV